MCVHDTSFASSGQIYLYRVSHLLILFCQKFRQNPNQLIGWLLSYLLPKQSSQLSKGSITETSGQADGKRSKFCKLRIWKLDKGRVFMPPSFSSAAFFHSSSRGHFHMGPAPRSIPFPLVRYALNETLLEKLLELPKNYTHSWIFLAILMGRNEKDFIFSRTLMRNYKDMSDQKTF